MTSLAASPRRSSTKLHTVLTGLGFGGEDREQKLVIAEVITGHDPLTGPEEGRTSKNLSLHEARLLIDTLDGMDRDALIAFMADTRTAYGRRPAMSDDPLVREIGRITDDAGRTVIIGVDHATVTMRTLPGAQPGRGGARPWRTRRNSP